MAAVFRGGAIEEWCNRRVLSRIHRLTLEALRCEIDRSARPTTVVSCSAGNMLRLRLARMASMAPYTLFGNSKATRFPRLRASLVVSRAFGREALSHAACEVYDEIASRGAPFFADIVRATKRLPAEVEEALWQLVAAVLVRADGFDALRSLVDRSRRLGEKGHRAARAAAGRFSRRKSKSSPSKRSRGVCSRAGASSPRRRGPRNARTEVADLLGVLRYMEVRGEIRGDRFVAAYVGEQFALPEAIDALRAARRNGDTGEICDVAAYDRLHVAALLVAGAPPCEIHAAS